MKSKFNDTNINNLVITSVLNHVGHSLSREFAFSLHLISGRECRLRTPAHMDAIKAPADGNGKKQAQQKTNWVNVTRALHFSLTDDFCLFVCFGPIRVHIS